MDRRQFLTAAGATAAATWLPIGRQFAADAAVAAPPAFPAEVEIFRQRYQNWSKEIVIDDLWTCRPTAVAQIVTVVNWARSRGWQVRARGSMHGWSPILVTPDTDASSRVVLVDTSGLAAITEAPGGVELGPGALLIDILTHLEGRGLGFESVPAVGDITIGGMLAIGAHGAAIPGRNEVPSPTSVFGSLSHAVRELDVVAWDPVSGRYANRTFTRADRELASLACALGRTFVTRVVLDAAPLRQLRCRSYIDIPASEMFAPAGTGVRTLASFLLETGRAEALWYPFTDNPWLKVWEVSPLRPLTSRPTAGPYNYPFSDQVPEEMADLARELVTGNPEATPTFGQLTYGVTAAGLTATASHDLWGPAKDTQLYIQATTLRVRELGLAVLTNRDHLQDTIHILASKWKDLVDDYAARGLYPINMPFEIRASALDGAIGRAPLLTATSPDRSAEELDVVLFTNPLTLTGTAGSDEFFAEYEAFVRHELDPARARLRPEWSKNYAYTADGPTRDLEALEHIRDAFRAGRSRPSSWDGAAATFERLDPAGVFTNDFLDTLFER